jgi:DNA-binding LacI/PurR family transcriptional regulator
VRPALTTVHIELEALGRQATTALLQLIAGRALDQKRIVLPTRLVMRHSAAPPTAGP